MGNVKESLKFPLSVFVQPQKGDVNGWCRLCFGDLKMKRPWDDGGSSTDEENRRKGKPPLLSVISHMDQVC